MSQVHRKHGTHHKHSARYESQKQKRDDALLRRTRNYKQSVVYGDTSKPLLDIGVDRIDQLIKSVISTKYEDSIQEAWARILNDHVGSEEDVLVIARQVSEEHRKENNSKK